MPLPSNLPLSSYSLQFIVSQYIVFWGYTVCSTIMATLLKGKELSILTPKVGA